MSIQFIKFAVCVIAISSGLVGCKKDQVTVKVNEPVVQMQKTSTNLALKRSATASSFEYDDHSPAKAVDGSTEEGSRWCAADGEIPQWLKVDLGQASTINACEITWEFDGKLYLYTVEGSIDGAKWITLADRSTPSLQKSTTQVQKLEFAETHGIQFVRVRVTSLEEGTWASISEIKILGW